MAYDTPMRVEWDPEKDRKNRVKHDLGFNEVAVLFESGGNHLTIYDEEHSVDEDRFLAVGPIAKGVVTVAYTEPKEDVIRIINARMATRGEEEMFYLKAGGPKQ